MHDLKHSPDPEMMLRAIDLAIENVRSATGGPFGAVIAREGRIISEGTNQVTVINDPTAHAEVVAIRKACGLAGTFELKDCELYTSCEPCPMCLGAIYWARVGRVYFAASRYDAANVGFDDSFIYDEIAIPFDQRRIKTVDFMRVQGLQAFEAWRASETKIPY